MNDILNRFTYSLFVSTRQDSNLRTLASKASPYSRCGTCRNKKPSDLESEGVKVIVNS
jgi:hypothetical protein